MFVFTHENWIKCYILQVIHKGASLNWENPPMIEQQQQCHQGQFDLSSETLNDQKTACARKCLHGISTERRLKDTIMWHCGKCSSRVFRSWITLATRTQDILTSAALVFDCSYFFSLSALQRCNSISLEWPFHTHARQLQLPPLLGFNSVNMKSGEVTGKKHPNYVNLVACV